MSLARDLFIACDAYLAALRVDRMLASHGLAATALWAKRGVTEVEDLVNIERATRIARIVNFACRHGIRSSTCLTRSLTLIRLLSRRGLESQLKIGVRIDDSEKMAAHAWVEVAGLPVNDKKDVASDFHVVPLEEPLGFNAFV